MILRKTILFLSSLLLATASGETLQIKLRPSVVFNDMVGDAYLLLFSVVEPPPNSIGCGCQDQAFGSTTSLPSLQDCESVCGWPCERVCGGVFTAELGVYDSIQFMFQAAESEAIRLRHPEDKPRYRAEFSAMVEDCTATDPYSVLHEQSVATVALKGDDTHQLEQYFNPENSFFELTTCGLSTRLEISSENDALQIEGLVNEITWTVSLPESAVANLNSQEYRFDTGSYTWIRTTYEGAIVADNTTDDPTVTSAPSMAPSPKAATAPPTVGEQTRTPSDAVLSSRSLFALAASMLLGLTLVG